MSTTTHSDVALFVTCLVDLFRPNVGFASIKLLQQLGLDVVVPKAQTCCGQPAYNSGDKTSAQAIAEDVINTFADYSAVVVPSGSCAGMLIKHYPTLFDEQSEWREKAQKLAHKTHELLSFLHQHNIAPVIDAKYQGNACYHHSCAGLRELNIQQQPEELLKNVKHLSLTPLPNSEVCCGFGGLFCVKFDEVSNKMVSDKTQCIKRSGADTLLAGDLGCLLNIAGKLSRENSAVKVWHTAEVLAGMTEGAAIGAPRTKN